MARFIVSLTTAPRGVGLEVGRYVKEAVKAIQSAGVTYQVTPMSTIFEADSLEQVFAIVTKAHNAIIEAGALRVGTTVVIDDRRDKERTMDDKVKAVVGP
jgi:uncharacterized protein (TIGR00106 family)